MRVLARYFLRGLVVIVPLVITLYVVYALFTWVDSLLPFSFPGPGVLVALVLTTLTGYLASNFLTRRLFDWMEAGLTRIPFVSVIYRSIKEITDAFVGDHPRFQRPVRLRFSDETDTYFVGFLTQEQVEVGGEEEYVAVYLPWSYNIGGNLIVVPARLVEPLPASSSRVMTYVMSGGLAEGGDADWPVMRRAPSG
ncbi:MAG: DUF502 domain-containing protein [Bacteroidetes bacterium]|jgi:uncharacterized membrane protein|nr:DUF502 domain-containing protein [Bacteroidota bacterium]